MILWNNKKGIKHNQLFRIAYILILSADKWGRIDAIIQNCDKLGLESI